MSTKSNHARLIFDEGSQLLSGPLIKKHMSFDAAQSYVSTLELNGLTGWRLPTLREMYELMGHPLTYSEKYPALPYIPCKYAILHTCSKVFGPRKDPYFDRHFYAINTRNLCRHNSYQSLAYVVPVRGLPLTSVAITKAQMKRQLRVQVKP